MNLTRTVGAVVLSLMSAVAAAQVTDPRQMPVPFPPFVVSSTRHSTENNHKSALTNVAD
jgi:hypothetical protein